MNKKIFEWQQGTAERHFQCALLQADGRRDLENGRRGDTEDLYTGVSGVELSNETLPSHRAWDGSDSGFIIHNISEEGAIMHFSTGTMPVDPIEGIVTGQRHPDLIIPDNTVDEHQ